MHIDNGGPKCLATPPRKESCHDKEKRGDRDNEQRKYQDDAQNNDQSKY